MPKGKIIYTPQTFRAITYADEAHYLSIADNAAFNMGAGDFGLDCLAYLSSAGSNTNPVMLSKWAGVVGYWLEVVRSTRTVNFKIGDSGGSTTVSSSAAAFNLDAFNWFYVGASRAGLASIYVNGSLAGSGGIASRAGSIDVAAALAIGGNGAANNYWWGNIGLARLDKGRVLSAAWVSEEWDRIRYGITRGAADFSAMWPFNDSLSDLSPNLFALTYNGGGSPAYTVGYPSAVAPISYLFDYDYQWGHETTPIDMDEFTRTIDGTLYSYKGPRKQKYNLEFECPLAQKTALLAAWQSGNQLQWYEDYTQPMTCLANIVAPPTIKSIFQGYYQISLQLEEA